MLTGAVCSVTAADEDEAGALLGRTVFANARSGCYSVAAVLPPPVGGCCTTLHTPSYRLLRSQDGNIVSMLAAADATQSQFRTSFREKPPWVILWRYWSDLFQRSPLRTTPFFHRGRDVLLLCK